jgi:hypothetical protein
MRVKTWGKVGVIVLRGRGCVSRLFQNCYEIRTESTEMNASHVAMGSSLRNASSAERETRRRFLERGVSRGRLSYFPQMTDGRSEKPTLVRAHQWTPPGPVPSTPYYSRDLGCYERPGRSVSGFSFSSDSLNRPRRADFEMGSGPFCRLVRVRCTSYPQHTRRRWSREVPVLLRPVSSHHSLTPADEIVGLPDPAFAPP